MSACPKCGESTVMQTRREHATDVLAGHALDETQKALVAAGLTPAPIEVFEDHPHPNLKGLDGAALLMKGNGGDVRDVCTHCGHYSPWRQP